MVAYMESFTTLNLSGGPSIHMVDDSQIPAIGRGFIKIHHGVLQLILPHMVDHTFMAFPIPLQTL